MLPHIFSEKGNGNLTLINAEGTTGKATNCVLVCHGPPIRFAPRRKVVLWDSVRSL